MSVTKLWLRGEVKLHEHRSALTPSVCDTLIKNGFEIVVERCDQRFFREEEFSQYAFLRGFCIAILHARD